MTENDKLFMQTLKDIDKGNYLLTSRALLSEELIELLALGKDGGWYRDVYIMFEPMFKTPKKLEWMND